MVTHEIKAWPQYFGPVLSGAKLFEIRLNDRNFKVDDVVCLMEFDPCSRCSTRGKLFVRSSISDVHQGFDVICTSCIGVGGRYTGRRARYRIGYILSAHAGLQDGYVIVSLVQPAIEIWVQT